MNKQKLIPRKSPIQRRVQYAKIGDEVRNDTEYTVDAWDSLYSIAQKYGISAEKLAEYNGISEDDSLQYGQILKIPSATKNYLNMSNEEFGEPVVRQVIEVAKEQPVKRPEKSRSIGNDVFRVIHNGAMFMPLPTKIKDYYDEYNSGIQMGTVQMVHDLLLDGDSTPFLTTLDPVDGWDYSDTFMGGTPQRTFFMRDRGAQERAFERAGYFQVKPDFTSKLPYGRVSNEALNYNSQRGEVLPMYQKHPDAIRRDQLEVVDLTNDSWYGPTNYKFYNGGSFYGTLYIDPKTGLLYQNAWDLNNYGGSGGVASKYSKVYLNDWDLDWLSQALHKVNLVSDPHKYAYGYYINLSGVVNSIDNAGLPVVVTTGYQPVTFGTDHHFTMEELKDWELMQKLLGRKKADYLYHQIWNTLYKLNNKTDQE